MSCRAARTAPTLTPTERLLAAYALSRATVRFRTHQYGGLVEGGFVACAACKRLLRAEEWMRPCEAKEEATR